MPRIAEPLRRKAVKLRQVLAQAVGGYGATLLVHERRDVARLDLAVLRPADGLTDPVKPSARAVASGERERAIRRAAEVLLNEVADRSGLLFGVEY